MPDRRSFLKAAGGLGATTIIAGCSQSTDSGGTATGTSTGTGGGGGSTGTTSSGGVGFGGDDEINMSLSPSVPQQALYTQYGPVRDHLEDFVESNTDADIDANMQVLSNYSAVIQSLGSGSTDIAETGPFAAALGSKSDNSEVILQRKGYGSWTYASIIAVPNDSDISSLSDLSGKTVAFADRLSTSGCLYPLYKMSSEGDVNIGSLPEGNGAQADIDPRFAGGHAASYNLLEKGQVDAAGMGAFVRDTGTGPSTSEFEDNATTLDETTGLPRAPIVVSPSLNEETKTTLQNAFLEAPNEIYYGADGEDGTDDDLWFSAVREATVDDYQSVIDVANELGVGTEIFQSGTTTS
jgi:phosphonate transport system substrate-binding protein